MIKVIRIAGESFDFETKKETPKALILSNGKTEFSLYVGDDVAAAVVRMMLESEPEGTAPSKSNGSAVVRSPTPVPQPKAAVASMSAKTPQMASVVDEELASMEDNLGGDPGEEYNDPATGAESL